MSGHRKKVEGRFQTKKKQDFSKLADEQDETDFLQFDMQDDEQYQSLTKNLKGKRKAEHDFQDYNEKTFKAKKVSKKSLNHDDDGL